jgi:hypothetical protein
MPVETNVYGTPEDDAVSYPISDVASGNVIGSAKWTDIFNSINSERARRGNSGIGNPGFSGVVQASDLNALLGGINYYWADGAKAIGQQVTASDINSVIDKLQYCGTVCVCNCNYCTCNCNYCTCNCNYACTCNCNYSDERLKENIEFIGMQNGIKIYTWNYKWDLETTHKGVIAQNLLGTKYESALSKDKDGFYMVDYSKLPIKI